jgi:hypothetical protein
VFNKELSHVLTNYFETDSMNSQTVVYANITEKAGPVTSHIALFSTGIKFKPKTCTEEVRCVHVFLLEKINISAKLVLHMTVKKMLWKYVQFNFKLNM